MQPETRKITVHIPANLLKSAQEATGGNITETITEGLKTIARARAYANLRALRGTLKLDVDLEASRQDKY